MGWKRSIKHSVGSSIKGAQKYIGHATKEITKPVTHRVERSIDRVMSKAQTAVEGKVEQTIEQVQGRISNEVTKTLPGIMLLGIGATIAAISILLFSLMIVQVLIEIIHVPSWIAYLIVSIGLAVISFVCVHQIRRRLFSND